LRNINASSVLLAEPTVVKMNMPAPPIIRGVVQASRAARRSSA
jgi:hypothetical protein